MSVTMYDYAITDRAPVLIGYEGENLSREFTVSTADDLSGFASIELVVGETNCGSMTITAGSGASTAAISLSASMIGKAGYKKAQLIMLDSTGNVVMKSNQFDVLVGASNSPRYFAAGENVKTLVLSIDGRSRQIVLPAGFIVSADGDLSVDKIAFRAPLTYGGFDFSDAACRVCWYGIDGTPHRDLCTATDSDGNWIWNIPSALTRGGSGEITFSVSYVITDENDAVTADWNTGLARFYNQESAYNENPAETAEDETTYDRLASAIADVRAAQATVEDINAILASLTSSTPEFVDTQEEMTVTTKLYVLTTNAMLYYYNGSSWVPAFEFAGAQEVINARTGQDGTVHANLKARLDAENAALKGDLSDIFTYSTVTTTTPISGIDGIYTRTGWNAAGGTVGIQMSTNASYDSYWFVTTEDVDIWFNDTVNASYLALIVGGTYQYSQEQSASTFIVFCENGATRYRKSEGNLPTENNKLHIPSGCAVAFTISAGAMESVYGLGQATEKTVKESFKEEIVKRNYLKYVSGNGADASTEKVEIYIPTASGYVRYDFLHTVSQAVNSDVWRVGYAYHTDDDFVANFSLTTAGEWECAVKLDGRDDFSGGYAHGDEVMNNVLFIVDGAPVEMTTLTAMTAFDDLCIIEDSALYDPADHTTIYAYHGSEHHFTSKGLTIRQSVKFIVAETVVTAYLAMLPIAKAVSNKVVPDNTFIPLSTDSAIRIFDTEKVVIYKTGGKVKAEFSAPIWEYLNPNGYTFVCVDNGTTMYNKCYFVNTLSGVSVPQDKLLKTETRYNFVVGE